MAAAKKPLVLIVDDDEKLREILRIKLEADGFDIVEAGNGKEAITAAKQNMPSLIVLDVRMPVMSGTEAVSEIKKDPALQSVPVLFLSAYGEADVDRAWIDRKVAQELGAVDYMKKTSNLSDIVAKIKELANA